MLFFIIYIYIIFVIRLLESASPKKFGGKTAYQSPLPYAQKWELCALGMNPPFYVICLRIRAPL